MSKVFRQVTHYNEERSEQNWTTDLSICSRMLYHWATLPHAQRQEDILGFENNLYANHLVPENTKPGHKLQRNSTKKHYLCAWAVQNNELN